MQTASAINIADLERLAGDRLDAGELGYFNGGAGDEITLAANVSSYSGWQLRPRMLVDVDDVSMRVELFGSTISMPILVAPVAFQRLVDPDGEEAMARAAAAAGTVMCLSTLATTGPARVAAAAPDGRRWFQLYCFRDRGVTRALMEEAVETGYEAIVLTVDSPRAGRRERDFRTGFAIPPDVDVPSLTAALGGDRPVTIQEAFAQVDAGLTWPDLESLAAECDLPILVKGILTGPDGDLAVRHGAAGVIVSNHGGRQLDRVPATIDALPEVVDAVDGRIPVLVDGGIRRGTDVLVALALGASAVMVGRPALWGLAAGGEAGAARALEILGEELETALTLSGCRTPEAVGRDLVQRAPGFG